MISFYLFCASKILSSYLIPELVFSVERENLSTIKFVKKEPSIQLRNKQWPNHWKTPDGDIVLSHRKDFTGHWLRFLNLADFKISLDGYQVTCFPAKAVPDETIRHLLLDQVLPRVLAFHGKLMFHASAVKFGEGVLLFMGDSRAGKSTLAGALHRAGYSALCDDCVWIKEQDGQVIALPSYPGLRLWGDSVDVLFGSKQTTQRMAHYSTKQRINLLGLDSVIYQSGAPLLGVILLQPSNDPGTPLDLQLQGLREGYLSIIKQSFFLDQGDIAQLQAKMQKLAEITPKINIWRLNYPRDYDQLPIIQDLILKTVR